MQALKTLPQAAALYKSCVERRHACTQTLPQAAGQLERIFNHRPAGSHRLSHRLRPAQLIQGPGPRRPRRQLQQDRHLGYQAWRVGWAGRQWVRVCADSGSLLR